MILSVAENKLLVNYMGPLCTCANCILHAHMHAEIAYCTLHNNLFVILLWTKLSSAYLFIYKTHMTVA